MSIRITTTVREEIYQQIKEKGWAFNELLELGYELRCGRRDENARINGIMAENKELRHRIAVLAERIQYLNNIIMKKGDFE